MKALHEGRHGFALTTVLSGLSDTLQVLRVLGVSRLSEGAAEAFALARLLLGRTDTARA